MKSTDLFKKNKKSKMTKSRYGIHRGNLCIYCLISVTGNQNSHAFTLMATILLFLSAETNSTRGQ